MILTEMNSTLLEVENRLMRKALDHSLEESGDWGAILKALRTAIEATGVKVLEISRSDADIRVEFSPAMAGFGDIEKVATTVMARYDVAPVHAVAKRGRLTIELT